MMMLLFEKLISFFKAILSRSPFQGGDRDTKKITPEEGNFLLLLSNRF